MLADWIDTERIIHSIKTAIACMIGILFARILGLSADQWIVVTIVVVMCAQIYVGSVIGKAAYRFLGTLIGCLFAVASLLLAGDTFFSIVITMALSALIFSYLATSNENLAYAGTLGAATTAIILLSPMHSIENAIERFLEISIGVLIATLVSQFLLPIHARSHIQRSQAKVLRQLCTYYQTCLNQDSSGTEPTLEDMDTEIIKSLAQQRQLAKEAGREPLGAFFDKNLFMQVLQCEKEILRSIDFINYTKAHIKNLSILLPDPQRFDAFNKAIMNGLTAIGRMIESSESENKLIDLIPFQQLKTEINKNRAAASSADIIYVDGLLVSAEILVNSMLKLAELNQNINKEQLMIAK